MGDSYKEIFSRLKEVLSAKTDADVARGLGVSTAALSSFKKHGKFPYERLVKFCLSKGISIDWLLTGKGDMVGGEEEGYENDSELREIVHILKHESPEAKRSILKILRARKEFKEGVEAFIRLFKHHHPYR